MDTTEELAKAIEAKVIDIVGNSKDLWTALEDIVTVEVRSQISGKVRKVILNDEELWMAISGRIKETVDASKYTSVSDQVVLWNKTENYIDKKIATRSRKLGSDGANYVDKKIEELSEKFEREIYSMKKRWQRALSYSGGPAGKAFAKNILPHGAEGWKCSHSSSRAGAGWNATERADLVESLDRFCEHTAAKHRRTEHSIKHKLQMILEDC